MSELSVRTAEMIDMLPEVEQNLAYELVKRIVLAWDPDFTKLTPSERKVLETVDYQDGIPMEDFLREIGIES